MGEGKGGKQGRGEREDRGGGNRRLQLVCGADVPTDGLRDLMI